MTGMENASACLAQGRCEPLGGHSVWASFPPPHGPVGDLPTTLVTAQMDGIGFFHDAITGADAPLSGLVAMLAAAEVLGGSQPTPAPTRRVVFAALAGEPWGYLGSKRLLWELQSGSNATKGLKLSTIDQVVEVGAVGRAGVTSAGATQLYFHSQPGREFGDVSGLWDAFREAATEVALSRADPGNGGIPPSSLTSFLRANRSISGAVLTEFDTAYVNEAYATSADELGLVRREGVTAAAVVLAKALASLLGNSQALQVNQSRVAETVQRLLECFAKEGRILDCKFATDLISRVGLASNYVGVLQIMTSDSQVADLHAKNDMSRFLWNFLAQKTSSGAARLASGSEGGCNPDEPCEADAVCVGFRAGSRPSERDGQCQFATAKYVPSYSTSFQCQDKDASNWCKWVVNDEAREWEKGMGWPPDPMWTESRWSGASPSMELFLRESRGVENAVLLAGIGLTAGSLVAVLAARTVYSKRLKQQ